MAAEGSSVRSRGKGFCYFSCCADCVSVVMKKGSLVQALLYDPETERYAFLLAKVEHTDFVDVSDYTFKSGFSKDKKNLWKSCIFMIDDLEADFYRATVYSDTAAKFWYDGFLELKPSRAATSR